jgi:tartrate dehydrogenase/decarboxylase/D-malate dehydrogenase
VTRQQVEIAVIAGDGIGPEVVHEGLRVLEAVSGTCQSTLEFTSFDFANAAYWRRHGKMLPDDWFDTLRSFDAIFFGAVGWPAIVPDHISLWGSLLQFRRRFDQYINLRPVRLIPGIRSPLSGRGPGDIDFVIVRENTEGEYSNSGGILFEETEREVAIQETVMTSHGVDRTLRYAFELAQNRPRRRLTSATKSNGISITMPFWDRRLAAIGREYPDIEVESEHIDILTAKFVLNPDHFDVVVGSNLFGDILSDLGPACAGTIGIAPSANINPTRDFPSLFEPVHGSAPDIAGQGIANPIGQIWSGALMLEHLGERDAAAAVMRAIESVLANEDTLPIRTPDLGGSGTTETLGRAIAEAVK